MRLDASSYDGLVTAESEFEARAEATLERLRAALDDSGVDAEVELSLGVLTIEFADGAKYVVNSHRAAKQIWMAAERSAWHFDLAADGRWVAARSGDELFSAVSSVVGKKVGKALSLLRSS